jgi:hypothetical protein
LGFGRLLLFTRDALRNGFGQIDWSSVGLWAIVTVGLFQPIATSLNYVFGANILVFASASEEGVVSSAPTPQLVFFAGLADTGLFAAQGNTTSVGQLLGIWQFPQSLPRAFSFELSPKSRSRSLCEVDAGRSSHLPGPRNFCLDFWIFGGGPNYGSQKFAFFVVIVATTITLPLGIM